MQRSKKPPKETPSSSSTISAMSIQHPHKESIKTSKEKHLEHKEKHQVNAGKYLRDAVYGALDGIITTFGCVSGVAGAELTVGVALLLGMANLVADGLSMAVGNYLGSKAELDMERKERQREEYEVDNFPDEERDEIREIFAKKGFFGANLEMVVDVICSNRQVWIDAMMVEECGILPNDVQPWKSAAVTFLSFNVAGFIPLLAYVMALYFPTYFMHMAFPVCVTITLMAIFGLGVIKGLVSGTSWLQSGLEMLTLGSMASFVAYYIGYVFHDIAT